MRMEWSDGGSFAARADGEGWVHRCAATRKGRARPTIFRLTRRLRHGLTCEVCDFFEGVGVGSDSSEPVWGHGCPDGAVGRVRISAPVAGRLVLTCRRCGHHEVHQYNAQGVR